MSSTLVDISKSRLGILILLMVMIFSVQPSFAFRENIPLTETFNIYNGLSDDTVNDVLSDSHGFIWVATYKGLDRYDRYHIKHISLNDPRSLCEDSHGNIWAGTYYSGLIHMVDNPAGVKVYEPEIADAHF